MSTAPQPTPNAVNIDEIIEKVMAKIKPQLDAASESEVDTDAIVADVITRVKSELTQLTTTATKEMTTQINELKKTLTSRETTIEKLRERVNMALDEFRSIGGKRLEPVPPSSRSESTPDDSHNEKWFLPTFLDEA